MIRPRATPYAARHQGVSGRKAEDRRSEAGRHAPRAKRKGGRGGKLFRATRAASRARLEPGYALKDFCMETLMNADLRRIEIVSLSRRVDERY